MGKGKGPRFGWCFVLVALLLIGFCWPGVLFLLVFRLVLSVLLVFFDRAGARPGWFGPLPRGAGMSNVPTCVGGVIYLRQSANSLKDAPRILSEAAVVGSPLSTIYADPET